MCTLDFDDPVSVWNRTAITRSRAPHRCDTCHQDIPVGSSYESVFWVADGEASREVQCAACAAIGVRFADAHGGSDPSPSYLLACLDECADDGDPDSARWETAATEIRERMP